MVHRRHSAQYQQEHRADSGSFRVSNTPANTEISSPSYTNTPLFITKCHCRFTSLSANVTKKQASICSSEKGDSNTLNVKRMFTFFRGNRLVLLFCDLLEYLGLGNIFVAERTLHKHNLHVKVTSVSHWAVLWQCFNKGGGAQIGIGGAYNGSHWLYESRGNHIWHWRDKNRKALLFFWWPHTPKNITMK